MKNKKVKYQCHLSLRAIEDGVAILSAKRLLRRFAPRKDEPLLVIASQRRGNLICQEIASSLRSSQRHI
ncbi:MAG: hypothetical protein N2748_04555, partial [candidate division WOR-3 bacterium]|nr:hypothetical protein [candidate division WOR-3 bacterium]